MLIITLFGIVIYIKKSKVAESLDSAEFGNLSSMYELFEPPVKRRYDPEGYFHLTNDTKYPDEVLGISVDDLYTLLCTRDIAFDDPRLKTYLDIIFDNFPVEGLINVRRIVCRTEGDVTIILTELLYYDDPGLPNPFKKDVIRAFLYDEQTKELISVDIADGDKGIFCFYKEGILQMTKDNKLYLRCRANSLSTDSIDIIYLIDFNKDSKELVYKCSSIYTGTFSKYPVIKYDTECVGR